jgi:hypothetical protein
MGGKIGANAYPMITLALNEGIREGEVNHVIEAVETWGESPELTGKTSVRGAIALALLDEDRTAEHPWWLDALSSGP